MHSTKRTLTKRITLGTLLIGTLAFAVAAEAGDRRDPSRHDFRVDRHSDVRTARHGTRRVVTRSTLQDARRIDRRLDRRGEAIDHQFDFLALLAAASGEYRLAYELDRAGDRIERRYDRRGDRILRNARTHRHDDRCRHSLRPDRQSRSQPNHDRHATRRGQKSSDAIRFHLGHR